MCKHITGQSVVALWREGDNTVDPRGERGPTTHCKERSLSEITFEHGLEGVAMRRGDIPAWGMVST